MINKAFIKWKRKRDIKIQKIIKAGVKQVDIDSI